jgi:hypothetical protein
VFLAGDSQRSLELKRRKHSFSNRSCNLDSVLLSSSEGLAGMFGTEANWE